MPRNWQWLLVISFPIFGWGCTTGGGGATSTGNFRYDYERQAMHPDFGAYHVSDDSTKLLVNLETRDLLFTKKGNSTQFQASLSVAIRLTGLDTLYSDTLFTQLIIPYQDKMPLETALELDMAVPEGYRYQANFTINDLHRSKEGKGSLTINKTNTSNHQNFLIRAQNGRILVGNTLPENSTIELTCARCAEDQLQLLQQKASSSFPPPPYSVSSFKPREFSESDLMLSLFFPQSRTISLDLLEGAYLFTTGNQWSQGRVVLTTPDLFPEVTTIEGMATTLRYITSRSEYTAITGPYKQRKAVEDFWIKSGGSQEKARELIRIYYGRVREANAYFSETVEGWKTDRGLIHIVFGNAKKIVKGSHTETWIYGEEDNLNALVFRFEKADHPQTDNRFLLERNELVKTRWERAITSWRNGRIYAE